ncbi:cysteine dioxygenase family protein [Gemmatimonadota bacterium]
MAGLKSMAGRGFPLEETGAFLAEVRLEPEELEAITVFREDRYARHRIYRDDDFELLVICWRSGQRAPIRGHEGQRCWARVEQGRLKFIEFRVVSEDPVRLEQVGEPVVGEIGFIDSPENLHQVENLVEFGEDVITLHLYAYPYDECDVYDSPTGPKHRKPLVCDSDQSEI